MNSATYRSIARLLENWPVDTTKKGRDFGEFIRQQVGVYFGVHSQIPVKESSWEEIGSRLNKLASNHYKHRFPVSKVSSASGLTEEKCNFAVATESLQVLEEEFSSSGRLLGRARQTVTRFFNRD